MSKNKRVYLQNDFQIIEDTFNQIDFGVFRSDHLVGILNDSNISNWMKHKEIKSIIHNFYKKEHRYFVSVGVDKLLSGKSTVDEAYRFILFQLQENLSYKNGYKSLNELETVLHLILTNDSSKQHEYIYSDQLVSEFKNVLKEVL